MEDFYQRAWILVEKVRTVNMGVCTQAYARAPVVTVNGSTDGFDGFRLGK